MANIVIFQGVEVTLPVDVAFAHQEGCLEIDLTGLSGKLRLRPGAFPHTSTGFTNGTYLNEHISLPVHDATR